VRLKDKVAIVTGGSQGIGEAVANAYAREGASVVVVNAGDRRRGERVAREISAAGGVASAIRADVTSKGEVEALAREVIESFGSIDVLFHAAGVMINRPFDAYTEEEWDRTIDVNLKGTFLMAQAVIPAMRAGGGGKVILVASIAGSQAFTNSLAYCASKGGVLMLAKALAAEVAGDGVNVNAISPGNTATPLNQHLRDDPAFVARLEERTPTGRAYLPAKELTGAAIFLASDEASAIHGLDLIVDDGWAA
jgi:NAD(P)-dependent dehydrogenase (short-subunit alcohol dehydrogenase family)